MPDALWAPKDAKDSRGLYRIVFDNYIQHLHIVGVYPEGDFVLSWPGIVFIDLQGVELVQHSF